jgi:hypothetical protein
MSAPGKQSRWGSLLSQAVAGVESRLDNILADPEDGRPQADYVVSPDAPESPSPAASTTAKQQQASQQLAPLGKPSPGMYVVLSHCVIWLTCFVSRQLPVIIYPPYQ